MRVNVIAPGRIDTERVREVYPDGLTQADLVVAEIPAVGTRVQLTPDYKIIRQQ